MKQGTMKAGRTMKIGVGIAVEAMKRGRAKIQ